ncbi:MAG: hypothetical protein WDW36_008387 [Sanguina aurantia]
MSATVNISAYKFISLDDLPALRERVLECCSTLGVKGTVLLAPEGINVFLAGSRGQIDAFMAWLHADHRFADVMPKESLSEAAPFGRLRVRLKREIITMRLPTIRPEGGRAPSVDAPTLHRWLAQGHDDDGRELLMLDTRNAYETDLRVDTFNKLFMQEITAYGKGPEHCTHQQGDQTHEKG